MTLSLIELQIFFSIKHWRFQRHIQNLVKHVRWSFFWKSLIAQLFLQKNLTCPIRFSINPCLLFCNFLHTVREKNFTGKKLEVLRNEFLQIFGEILTSKLLHLPKTNLFIIFLKKKTKSLKFLFTTLLEG